MKDCPRKKKREGACKKGNCLIKKEWDNEKNIGIGSLIKKNVEKINCSIKKRERQKEIVIGNQIKKNIYRKRW